jgi:ABC-type branched-subunit amino acid transport system ATPase component
VLSIEGLFAGYGKKAVLHGVDLVVMAGDIVAVVGANGSGKSTLLKAIMGLCRVFDGSVAIHGRVLTESMRTDARVRQLSVGYLPQGHRVFGELTVDEHLQVTMGATATRDSLSEAMVSAFELFPPLALVHERRAAVLSGGERQMLATAPLLARKPSLLLLDEPTTGLAEEQATAVLDQLADIITRGERAAVVIEHTTAVVLRYATRVVALKQGRVTFNDRAEMAGKTQDLAALLL